MRDQSNANILAYTGLETQLEKYIAMAHQTENNKSLESWIWDAACSIRGAKDAPKYKEFILPLIFTKRLCDVFDDEINRIAKEVGSRAKAFKLVKHDKKLVRFFLPLEPKNPDDPVWSVIRTLSDKIGEQLTTQLRAIADANPLLKGIIDRVDFNATTHGQRDIDDDRLSNLIEAISAKRLGLDRRRARHHRAQLRVPHPQVRRRQRPERGRVLHPDGGRLGHGSHHGPGARHGHLRSLLRLGRPAHQVRAGAAGEDERPLAQEPSRRSSSTARKHEPGTWAMANMNMIIHDMEGEIQIGDTFRKPKFRQGNRLQTFDRVVANPMWNQTEFKEKDYDADELDRFPKGAGFPGGKADWGWVQHILASLNDAGPRRRRARHRRRLTRLRQRQHQQGKRRAPLVRRAGPDRGRHLPAGEPFLQHHRAGHHPRPEPGQAEGAQRTSSSCSTPAASSPKATRRTTSPMTPSAASPTPSAHGRKWRNTSRIVSREEIAKNDFNISPSRYIHTGEADEYRPIAEIRGGTGRVRGGG